MAERPVSETSAVAQAQSGSARATEDWHGIEVAAVLAVVDSTPTGLSPAEAARRLVERGPNDATAPTGERWWSELLESLGEPLQLLLIGVAVLSAVFGEIRDAVAIAVIIGAVAAIETLSEQRARRAIDALRRLAAPTARVVRDGIAVERPAVEVVVGDVVVLEAGDVVPADGRVLTAEGLRTDESSLTGEAVPASKGSTAVPAATPLAERTSMAYAGASVVAGEGRIVVVATGADTELGRLGTLVTQERSPATPLQAAMGQLARGVLILAVAASVLVPLVGVAAGQPAKDMLLAGLSLAFATIPEELPILVTVLLAIGGRQLARRGALLRRLEAGETLGAVTMVVTDKTGTLTENRLRIATLAGEEGPLLSCALATQALSGPSGEPMEQALAERAAAVGRPVTGEPVTGWPFDPDRKLVTRCWHRTDRYYIAVGGAPEAVLARCVSSDADRGDTLETVRQLATRGLRVIAFAERDLDRIPADRDAAEQQLRLVGLVGFEDPVRADAPEAVGRLHAAGVGTIVVTGDHPLTASAAARLVGLPAGVVLRGGADLAAMTDPDLLAALRHGTVIARATPTDKLRVVRVLQGRREVVAVTGDGVNDAPALAAADVGIAMGQRGTDLARNAADVVLTDDAFATIDAAVEKGRSITSQLRRAVAFYLGAKVALVLTVAIPLLLGKPAPFAPVHIVLLELFMDLGASTAFVSEPAAPGAMTRPPRAAGAPFLDRAVLSSIATVGIVLALATTPLYILLTSRESLGVARAATVAAWLSVHAIVAWSLRAQPTLRWRDNPAFPAWALLAVAAAVVLAGPVAPAVGLHAVSSGVAAAVGAVAVTAIGGLVLLRRYLHLAARL